MGFGAIHGCIGLTSKGLRFRCCENSSAFREGLQRPADSDGKAEAGLLLRNLN